MAFEGVDFPMEERIVEVQTAGRFDAEVTKAEEVDSETGRQGIRLTFTFRSGDMEGRILSDTIWLPFSADKGQDWGQPGSSAYQPGAKYEMMGSRASAAIASTGFPIVEHGGLNPASLEAFMQWVVGQYMNVSIRVRYVGFDGQDVRRKDALLEDGTVDGTKVMETRQEIGGYRSL